jgi:D,D-heptose 1,7-bisphosphate phosphatase
MKAVIMAGGRGTRISSVNSEVPKPMIRICGKPILEYQLECLRKQDCTDIILVIGHLGHVIREYFGGGEAFGVKITYIEESEPLGTAGALYLLKNQLTEDFLLINGDIVFDFDIGRFYAYHRRRRGAATLFTHPNNHPYDSGIIITDGNGLVLQWLHKENERFWVPNRVNAGIHFISPEVFGLFTELKKTDLDREVFEPLIAKGRLYAYESTEYAKDMGTPQRYLEVGNDITEGKVRARNLGNMQKAIFLDRDGTINKCAGFISQPEQFELLDGTAEAIRKINESGYLAIVVTNQPVIARGEATLDELRAIHNKMETLLGREGAYVDAIYICPHHPDKGFPGERPEYKIDCTCRKPEPGMLLQAAADYHIDLRQSHMIGDKMSDIQAGAAAGCTSHLVNEQTGLLYVVEQLLTPGP